MLSLTRGVPVPAADGGAAQVAHGRLRLGLAGGEVLPGGAGVLGAGILILASCMATVLSIHHSQGTTLSGLVLNTGKWRSTNTLRFMSFSSPLTAIMTSFRRLSRRFGADHKVLVRILVLDLHIRIVTDGEKGQGLHQLLMIRIVLINVREIHLCVSLLGNEPAFTVCAQIHPRLILDDPPAPDASEDKVVPELLEERVVVAEVLLQFPRLHVLLLHPAAAAEGHVAELLQDEVEHVTDVVGTVVGRGEHLQKNI